jgi:hypothetical protein
VDIEVFNPDVEVLNPGIEVSNPDAALIKEGVLVKKAGSGDF